MPSTVIFDFDDTLYSHLTKEVPVSAKLALQQLQENGHRIIIATGRGAEAAEMIVRESGVTPKTMVLMNGQIICENGEVVYEKHINLPSFGEIINIAKTMKHACGGYYCDGILVNEINRRVQAVWQNFSSPMPKIAPSFEKSIKLYQGHLYITQQEAKYYSKHLEDYVLNWSHKFLLNLIPKKAGKAKALRWCFLRYGINAKSCYAFGDGFNDADMLEEVGHGVAMANASPALQALAEHVAARPDEDGICLALRHFGLI